MNKLLTAEQKNTLDINEIFFSIQGESTLAGLPCIFIRLSYCNLRCSWCDTAYAFKPGTVLTFDQIRQKIRKYPARLVEITGGEPLLQENVYGLIDLLLQENYQVLIETGGQMDISRVPSAARLIMDVKCPSSGESDRNDAANLKRLRPGDELKFVLSDRRDYEFARSVLEEKQINPKHNPVLFSTVFNRLKYEDLAAWILADGLEVRLQIQLHKIIWHPEMKGV